MESNLGDFLPASTCPTWWCDNCWESRQEPIQPIKGSHFYGRQLQQIRGNLTDFWSAPNLHCASNWYVAYCRVFCVTRIWRWQRKMLWFSFRWKGQFAALRHDKGWTMSIGHWRVQNRTFNISERCHAVATSSVRHKSFTRKKRGSTSGNSKTVSQQSRQKRS